MDENRWKGFTQSNARISKEVGGSLVFLMGSVTGRNLELQEGKLIVQQWRFGNWPDGIVIEGLFVNCLRLIIVRLTFDEPEPGITIVKVVHTDIPEKTVLLYGNETVVENTERGWRDLILNKIRATLLDNSVLLVVISSNCLSWHPCFLINQNVLSSKLVMNYKCLICPSENSYLEVELKHGRSALAIGQFENALSSFGLIGDNLLLGIIDGMPHQLAVNLRSLEFLVVVAFIWVGICIPKDADFADKGASQSKLFYLRVHFCHGRMPCPPFLVHDSSVK
ncbi:hypothetical protein NC652_017203 [Populus alba x Populus x berolinensis]|nr:hypothetical protein NC652_017203 [Populus alba x Populus x berolinensis]